MTTPGFVRVPHQVYAGLRQQSPSSSYTGQLGETLERWYLGDPGIDEVHTKSLLASDATTQALATQIREQIIQVFRNNDIGIAGPVAARLEVPNEQAIGPNILEEMYNFPDNTAHPRAITLPSLNIGDKIVFYNDYVGASRTATVIYIYQKGLSVRVDYIGGSWPGFTYAHYVGLTPIGFSNEGAVLWHPENATYRFDEVPIF